MKPPRDPRTNHPGHEPSEPPKRVLGVPLPPKRPAVLPPPEPHVETSAPVLPPPPPQPKRQSIFADALSKLAGAWTPAAVAGAIVAIIVALGGAAGIRELVGANAVVQRRLDEIEKNLGEKIDKKFKEHEKTEQAARAEITTDATVTKSEIAQVAELACQLNDGKPNESWPCGDQRFDPPTKGNLAPRWRTARAYPRPP